MNHFHIHSVDFACNFIGIRKWIDQLQWTGAKAYATTEERSWYLPGKEDKEIAGEVRGAGNGLVFATFRGAGHLGEWEGDVEWCCYRF